MRHRVAHPWEGLAAGAMFGVAAAVAVMVVWLAADLIVSQGLVREFVASSTLAGGLAGFWKERWGNV